MNWGFLSVLIGIGVTLMGTTLIVISIFIKNTDIQETIIEISIKIILTGLLILAISWFILEVKIFLINGIS